MKRLHIHLAVDKLHQNIAFYSALFQTGLDHLGIQVESESKLEEVQQILQGAALPVIEQKQAACCYVESDKYWTVDPQGIPWEDFHSLKSIPIFGKDSDLPMDQNASCCSPSSNCCPS